MWLVLEALRKNGGAATIGQINELVADLAELTPDQRVGRRASGDRKDFDYRCAWARTHLKTKRLIERAGTKQWRLTGDGWTVAESDIRSKR